MNETRPISQSTSTTIGPSADGQGPGGQRSVDDALDWYYRIGERERGPLTLLQLKELVASSGDLAREIEVRQHTDGAWGPYAAVDAVTARRLHADRAIRPATTPAPKPTAAGADTPAHADAVRVPWLKRGARLGKRIRANWPIAVGVLVWAGLNLVLWLVLDPFRRTEQNYYQILTKAAQKAREARTLDDASRGRIAAAVVQETKPLVEDLKKTANASEPIRQHLLWAAKDQLPKLFSSNARELGECEGIFQRHMYEAGRRLGIDVSRPQTQVVIR
jgi:hypothetical protein